MKIRELQGRVQYLRPDLPVGFSEQALQDAARYVARKTGIIRKTVAGYFPADTVRVDLNSFMNAVTEEYTILRATQLMCYAGINRQSVFSGTINATSPTIPLPTIEPDFNFFVATTDVTAFDGVTSYPMAMGDTIQVLNNVWVVTPNWKYAVMRDKAKGKLFGTVRTPLNSYGAIADFMVDDKNTLLLSPVPNTDTPCMITCSIVPSKEFDEIDIPVDAEDAIIMVARERILGTPNKAGGGADQAAARKAKLDADGEISLVRAIAEGGYGEVMMAAPPHFGN